MTFFLLMQENFTRWRNLTVKTKATNFLSKLSLYVLMENVENESGVNFIPKKLSTNKWVKKLYPEELSKIFIIQDVTPHYIKQMTLSHFISNKVT